MGFVFAYSGIHNRNTFPNFSKQGDLHFLLDCLLVCCFDNCLFFIVCKMGEKMNTTLIYILIIIGIIVLAIVDWKLVTKAVREYEKQTEEQKGK